MVLVIGTLNYRHIFCVNPLKALLLYCGCFYNQIGFRFYSYGERMLEHILAKAGLFIGLFSTMLIFISFLIYLANKKSYGNLVSLFKEKYSFPAPSSFYHMMGFFGLFPVSRFFNKLSKKRFVSLKRIILLTYILKKIT